MVFQYKMKIFWDATCCAENMRGKAWMEIVILKQNADA